MIYVGLDISITSPAICIMKDKVLFFTGYYREDAKFTKAQVRQIEFLNTLDNVTIKVLDMRDKDVRYSNQEVLDYIDGIKSMTEIYNEVIKYTKGEEVKVGIEGFSYGSKGSSVSKLYGYQFLLRHILYTNNIEWQIFAPTTVKKVAGHGRYKKQQMIESFLNNQKELDILDNNEIKNAINDNLTMVKPNSKYLKPFEDLCDAFWVAQALKEKL